VTEFQRVPTGALADRARDLVSLRSPADLARRLDPGYQTRAHTELISRAYQEIAAGTADRILITTPPQVGKSTQAAVWGSLWWLARNPTQRVIVASYAADLAERSGRDVRQKIETYGHRFGLSMARGSTAVGDWSLRTGGGMRCVGVGGGLTGHTAHITNVDDPHADRAQANSQRMRNRVWDWWSSTLYTRGAPNSPIILTMTLWHPDDLAGRLLDNEGDRAEGGRWLVLRCPAFATAEDDPLGRAIGEPLPHTGIPDGDTAALTAHWSDRKAGTNVRDWSSMYQCDPQPEEGALLSAEQLTAAHQFTNHPPAQSTVVAVDPSGDGRDTAGIIGGFLGRDGRVFITHDRTAVMPVNTWARAACRLAADIGASRIIVEKNFGGGMGAHIIRTAWDSLEREWNEQHPAGGDVPNPYGSRLPPRLDPVPARGSKADRADPVAQQLIEGRVKFGAYLTDVEREWMTWQPDDPDSPGRIDAMVHLVHRLLRPPKSKNKTTNPANVQVKGVPRAPGSLGQRIRRSGGINPPGPR